MEKYKSIIANTLRLALPAICLLLIMLCIYLANTLNQVSERYQYAFNDLKSQIHEINDSVHRVANGITSNNNYVVERTVEYGAFNPDSDTIPIKLSFRPEGIKSTDAILLCNGEEITMSFDGSMFSAEMQVSIFEPQEVTGISFVGETGTLVESLLWTINPIEEVAPLFSTNGYARPTLEFKDDGVKYSNPVFLYVYDIPDQCKIKELNILEVINESTKSTMPINIPLSYLLTDAKNFTVSKEIKGFIPKGNKAVLIAEIVDNYGLRYQRTIWRQTDHEGTTTPVEYEHIAVYDKSGNLRSIL